MLVIFIRSVITFSVLLVVMRLMGKRQIGEMQPFELVITLLIAELACIPMSDVSIPLVYGISAILAVFIIHQILSTLERSNRFFKRIISGKPSLVLTKEGVDFEQLRKNDMDVEDLIESMRTAGYYSLDDLDYAIFESNGNFSAKEKSERSESTSMPIILASDGKFADKNLEIARFDRQEIMSTIKKRGINSIKKVGVMTLDGNGKVYLQEKGKKYETFNVKLKDGIQW